MDEEMEEAPLVFVCVEIDLDYEYDAPRCYDLGREETPEEAWGAELWFETAGSYPPSPLFAKINAGRDFQADTVNTISSFENLEFPKKFATRIGVAATGFSDIHDDTNEGAYHCSIQKSEEMIEHRTIARKPFSRISTLMKPTASQLAKQDQLFQRTRRFQKHLGDEIGKGFEEMNDCAHQAAKRQRLERGHFYKVVGVKQQVDLFHKAKAPEKKIGFPDLSTQVPRMRITIPREPQLQTARRALHVRAQPRSGNSTTLIQETTSTSTFKAWPLNRRILVGPSLPLPQRSTPKLPTFNEFNLRTHERAIQHSTTMPPSMKTDNFMHAIERKTEVSPWPQCQSSIPQLLQKGDNKMQQGKDALLKFKAQPLHKKVDPISSSKSDVLFRSKRREPTKPKESKFSAVKKSQPAPLSELFVKLSLTSGSQNTKSRPRFPQSSTLCKKDSKENKTTARCARFAKELGGCRRGEEINLEGCKE